MRRSLHAIFACAALVAAPMGAKAFAQDTAPLTDPVIDPITENAVQVDVPSSEDTDVNDIIDAARTDLEYTISDQNVPVIPEISTPIAIDIAEPVITDIIEEGPLPPMERGEMNDYFRYDKCEVTTADAFQEAAARVHEYSIRPLDVPRIRTPGLTYSQTVDAQRDLNTLGFNIGIDGIQGRYTTLATMKFQMFYGPIDDSLEITGQLDEATLERLSHYAAQAKLDAEAYGVPSYAVAAVRLAQMRTGADFEYMMDLAQQESGFRRSVRASTSTAGGMYQFVNNTWLSNIYRSGCKYGLQDIADEIIYEREELTPWQMRNGREAKIVATIEDERRERAVIALRNSPHLAAIMSAENNQFEANLVASFLSRDLNHPTEDYVVHFLGYEDGYWFLKNLDENPDDIAADLLVEPARSNRSVFYERRTTTARSYTEVYDFFDEKFTSGKFEDHGNFAPYPRPEYARVDTSHMQPRIVPPLP